VAACTGADRLNLPPSDRPRTPFYLRSAENPSFGVLAGFPYCRTGIHRLARQDAVADPFPVRLFAVAPRPRAALLGAAGYRQVLIGIQQDQKANVSVCFLRCPRHLVSLHSKVGIRFPRLHGHAMAGKALRPRGCRGMEGMEVNSRVDTIQFDALRRLAFRTMVPDPCSIQLQNACPVASRKLPSKNRKVGMGERTTLMIGRAGNRKILNAFSKNCDPSAGIAPPLLPRGIAKRNASCNFSPSVPALWYCFYNSVSNLPPTPVIKIGHEPQGPARIPREYNRR